MRKTSTLILSLLAAMLLSTSVNAQVFFTEDFEGTMNATTDLPTNWTESTSSTDGGWNTDNATNATSPYLTWPVPTNGAIFAYTNDDGCNCDKSNDRMILPSQNFSLYTAVNLTFDLYINGGYGEMGYVLVSINSGTSWDTAYTAVGNTTAWQDGITVNLTPYAGQAAVLIAFAYNDASTWAYGMGVDDVALAQLASPEDLEAVSASGEYTKIPLSQATAMSMEADITNNGVTNATDAVVTTRVLSSSNGFTVPVQTSPSGNTTVNVGDTVTVLTGTYTPTTVDTFIFQHIVSSLTLVDGVPSNDTIEYTFEVTGSTYARDDSIVTIGLGINGTGNTSTLGVNYTFNTPVVIGAVTFGFTGVAMGDTTEVVIYNTDATGMPTTPIDSVMYLMAAAGPTVETASFPSGVNLAAGEYFFGLKEFTSVDNAGLMGTDDIFTPLSAWGSVNGGAYASIESLNFDVTFLIRPTLAPPCTNSSSTANPEICDGDVYSIGNSMYTVAGTYVDTLIAPGGCDSIVTTNLTVNALPSAALMGVAAMYCTDDSPVTMTGAPAGGTFAGPGVIGSTFSPTAAGVGMHAITYSFTDNNGCTGVDTIMTDVSICIGIEEGIASVSVSPNPKNGQFKLSGLSQGMEYTIFDLQGKVILSKTAAFNNEAVVLENQAAGLYFLKLTFEGESKQLKIVIE